MKQPQTIISRAQSALTRLLEWVCIAIMLVLIFDVLWGVISRFVLRAPSRWTDELATFLLIWVAMLGAAVAHGQNSHLGVNWLLLRLDTGIARSVGRFIHLTVILFAAIVMVYGGIVLVRDRFERGQVLPALGWSKAWMYMAVPVAGVFIVAYSVRELLWPTAQPPSAPEEQPPPPPPATARTDATEGTA